jgi:ribonuclease Z
MKPRLPFRYLEPTFFAGLFDDPVLWLKVRPLGRSLMFDCGQIHHLAKRVIKSVDALFVSHAHMDHFMGIDYFTRQIHVAPRTIELYGPPGIAARLASKLAGYDWNLSEEYWCDYLVHEVHLKQVLTFILPGRHGFPLRYQGRRDRPSRVIYRNAWLTVEAELGDHKIPVLMFRITEKPHFRIDDRLLRQGGWLRGAWIGELQRRFGRGELATGQPLRVLRRTGSGTEEIPISDVELFYQNHSVKTSPASIGYLTDIGFTEENRERVRSLLKGVSLLVCECTFLAEDRERARVAYHLCTDDLNALVEELRPDFLLPMHLSKGYIRRSAELYRQLRLPDGVTLLRLPDRVPPRPLLPCEVPAPAPRNGVWQNCPPEKPCVSGKISGGSNR